MFNLESKLRVQYRVIQKQQQQKKQSLTLWMPKATLNKQKHEQEPGVSVRWPTVLVQDKS